MHWVRSAWTIFWLCVLAAALVFQGVSAYRQPYFRLADAIGLATLGLLIFKHLTAHYERFHLLVEKAKLWLFNSTTEWSLEVHLVLNADDAEDDPAAISSRLESILHEKYTTEMTADRRTPTDFHFRLDRKIAAVARTTGDDHTTAIHISILDMAVSYRDSIDRIEKHLCPMFQLIEHHFHARPDGHKYGLVAHFRDGNPYFGVFIQKLKVASVDAFNLTIKTDKKDSVLSVKRDRVELVARSLDNFKTESVNTFRLGMGAS